MLRLGVILLAAAMIAGVSVAEAAPRAVTFEQLVAHPKQFSGTRVVVTAYYVIDSAEHSSYLATRPDAAERGLPQIFVDLPRRISDAQAHAATGHRVQVVGRFDYRELKVRVISRDIEEHTLGYGWMGIYDKQITKISQFSVQP